MMTAAGESSKPCILLGAGGHAKVVMDMANSLGLELHGVCDPRFADDSCGEWEGINILGTDEYLETVSPRDYWILNGIGFMPGSSIRCSIYERLVNAGYVFPALIHPSAVVSGRAQVNDGAQVMAGCIIQAGTAIGSNSIINTGAKVDHDSHVGAHCHLAPGSMLCGNVNVGDQAFIGAGAIVIQGLNIEGGSVVKAGALVKRDYRRI